MDLAKLWGELPSLAAAGAVLLALGWAAVQRGIAHHVWARLRERRDASIDWCMAMGSVLGCV